MPFRPMLLKQGAALLQVIGALPLHRTRVPFNVQSTTKPAALGTVLTLGLGSNHSNLLATVRRFLHHGIVVRLPLSTHLRADRVGPRCTIDACLQVAVCG